MIIYGVDYPTEIINAIRQKKLVVFAGAGVSIGDPTNMPNFNDLTEKISKGMFNKFDSDAESAEQYLGELEALEVPVKKMTCDILSGKESKANILHDSITRLFNESSSIKIVTTNYDLMFEQSFENNDMDYSNYSYPAIPFGNEFNGIIHLHGIVSDSQNIILTDADFGKAYLINGQVSRFLVKSILVCKFLGYDFVMGHPA